MPCARVRKSLSFLPRRVSRSSSRPLGPRHVESRRADSRPRSHPHRTTISPTTARIRSMRSGARPGVTCSRISSSRPRNEIGYLRRPALAGDGANPAARGGAAGSRLRSSHAALTMPDLALASIFAMVTGSASSVGRRRSKVQRRSRLLALVAGLVLREYQRHDDVPSPALRSPPGGSALVRPRRVRGRGGE